MEKILLLFDFDKIKNQDDIIHNLTLKFLPNLYKKYNGDLYKVNRCIPFNNKIFKEMKENKIKLNQLKEEMSKLELSPNFKEVFSFFKIKKKNLILI